MKDSMPRQSCNISTEGHLVSHHSHGMEKTRRYFCSTLMGLAASSSFVSLHARAATTSLKTSGSFGEATHHTQNLRNFARTAEKLSAGELTFEISVNAQLVAIPNIVQALSKGEVAVGEIPMANFVSEFPVFTLDSIPFLVRGYEDAALLWEVSKEKVSKDLLSRGIRLLYVTPWPEQTLFSRVPLQNVQDLKGQRLWASYAMTRHFGEKIGAKVVEFPVPQAAKAIENSEIDVLFASCVSGVAWQIGKHLKHCYETRAWITKNMVAMNEGVYQKLSPAAQKALLTAAQEAEKNGWQLVKIIDEQARKTLLDQKISIQIPANDLRIALNTAGERVGIEWTRTAGLANTSILSSYYQKKQNIQTS